MILHSKLCVVPKVQEEVIDGLEILKMTDLCTFYVGQLKELGLNILGYRSEKLKNRLIKHLMIRFISGIHAPAVNQR